MMATRGCRACTRTGEFELDCPWCKPRSRSTAPIGLLGHINSNSLFLVKSPRWTVQKLMPERNVRSPRIADPRRLASPGLETGAIRIRSARAAERRFERRTCGRQDDPIKVRPPELCRRGASQLCAWRRRKARGRFFAQTRRPVALAACSARGRMNSLMGISFASSVNPPK